MAPVDAGDLKVKFDDQFDDFDDDIFDEEDTNEDVNEDACQLDHWIDEPSIVDYLKGKKINKLFPWQAECLKMPGVFDRGKNLVFSASTSAGKSLVAEILALRHVFARKKKVMIILPFISIVREKLTHLTKLLYGTKIRVGGFMGTHHTKGGLELCDIAICTNEKANSYINRLLQENTLHQIGAIIVDEVHSIAEPRRGPLLELMLTKILVACKMNPSLCIQLIAMSATLPNLDHLAKWLKAEMYVTEFRPVPLAEKLLIGRTVFTVKDDYVETHKISEERLHDDNEVDVYLIIRSVMRNESVLLFLNDKAKLEKLALKISNKIYYLGTQESKAAEKIQQVITESNALKVTSLLKSCPIKADPNLYKCVAFGVGYHHGSLCIEHREIIEESYKAGWIKVLLATSTLSAGVNLPVRLVIVRSPKFLGNLMDPLMYRQMIGRAGRMGIDDQGESILLCTVDEGPAGKTLAKMPLSPVESKMFHLEPEKPFEPVAKAVLESIVTGLARTDEEIDYFLSCCYHFASSQAKPHLIPIFRSTAIRYLKDKKFVSQTNSGQDTFYEASHLGSGTVAGSFNPEDGLRLLVNLEDARKGLVLTSDLHLLFLIVPLSYVKDLEPDYGRLRFLFDSWKPECTPPHVIEVMNALQLTHEILSVKIFMQNLENKEKKFIVALVLEDLIKEMSIDSLYEKYGIEKPQIQNLQNYAASYAGMVASFCERLRWHSLEIIISRLVSQLTFGIEKELIDLMSISILNSRLARTLYKAEIKDVQSVAQCSFMKLKSILMPMCEYNDASRYEMWIESRKQMMSIDQLARDIQSEARRWCESQFRGVPINWDILEAQNDSQHATKGPRKRKKANK